jgi:hypothetical protein
MDKRPLSKEERTLIEMWRKANSDSQICAIVELKSGQRENVVFINKDERSWIDEKASCADGN